MGAREDLERHLRLGDHHAAIRRLRDLPRTPARLILLGTCLEQVGELTAAREAWSRVLLGSESPAPARSHIRARLLIGRLDARRYDRQAARGQWTAGLRLARCQPDPGLIRDLALELAALADAEDDRPEADHYLNIAAAADPGGPETLVALARRAGHAGDHATARRLVGMAAARAAESGAEPPIDGEDERYELAAKVLTWRHRDVILGVITRNGVRPPRRRRTPSIQKELWVNQAPTSRTGIPSRSSDDSTPRRRMR